MAKAVVGNAILRCSFGIAPSNLVVTGSKIKVGGQPVATITQSVANVNVPSFGMCTSPTNPQVAAMIPVPPIGVIKPQPCVPMLPGSPPWLGCATKVKWSRQPPLTSDGCLTCQWAGAIKISFEGQAKLKI